MRRLRRMEHDIRRRIRRTTPELRRRLPGLLQAERFARGVRHIVARILPHLRVGVVARGAADALVRRGQHYGSGWEGFVTVLSRREPALSEVEGASRAPPWPQTKPLKHSSRFPAHGIVSVSLQPQKAEGRFHDGNRQQRRQDGRSQHGDYTI
jgi:hypothetical protein